MAYDEELASRVRTVLRHRPDISERKMFGGLALMVGTNFCAGVYGSEIMCRVGPDAYQEALARPGAREMDITGRPARGIVFVGSPAIDDEASLAEWVERSYRFAASLPPKTRTKPTRRRRFLRD